MQQLGNQAREQQSRSLRPAITPCELISGELSLPRYILEDSDVGLKISIAFALCICGNVYGVGPCSVDGLLADDQRRTCCQICLHNNTLDQKS